MAMLVITRGYMQHIPAGNVQFPWRPLFLSTCIGRWFRSAFLHLSGKAKNIISVQLIFWGVTGIIMGFHGILVENHELYIYIQTYTLWYFNIDMENHLHTNFHGYLNYCRVCVCGVQYNDPKFRQTRTQNKKECLKMLAIHSINCYSLLVTITCVYIYIVTPNSLHDIPMLYVIPLAINSTNSQRDCILLIHYIPSIYL